MGGVKGKSRVCGFSTCVLVPCGYVALWAVLKVSLGYVSLALVYCCPAGCSFTGGVDSKPSIEVLALVRCVEYCLWYVKNEIDF
jgi:hypothetical protein